MLLLNNFRIALLALCGIVLLASCSNKKDSGAAIWRIIDVDVEDGWDGQENSNFDNCFLAINEDDTYTFFLKGFFSQGKIVNADNEYKMLQGKEEKLVAAFNLRNENKSEATLAFNFFKEKEVQKTNNSDEEASSTELPANILTNGFSADVERQKRATKADFYTSGLNKWRIKATKKENDKEIKDRVKNHLEFMQVFFENALEINLNTMSEANLCTPFEIYSNGAALRAFEKIGDWKSLFFDEQDARKGYDLLETQVEKDFAIIESKNTFEVNADIFRKLVKLID